MNPPRSGILAPVVRRGSAPGPRPVARRWTAALLAAVLALSALGLHAAVHDHSEAALPASLAIAACASHLATVHVEARRTVRVPECPACLLSHLNHGAARPSTPAIATPTPSGGSAGAAVPAVARVRDPSICPRAPPSLLPALAPI